MHDRFHFPVKIQITVCTLESILDPKNTFLMASSDQCIAFWVLLYSSHFNQNIWKIFVCVKDTCFGVSSFVADEFQSGESGALVIIRVELELRLCVIAVLHEWDLFQPTEQEYESRLYINTNTSVELQEHPSNPAPKITTLPAFLMGRLHQTLRRR